jgi:SAM-dependent methyltransferase
MWHYLAQQFRRPTGFLGRLAGFLFRINREGIEWTISLIEVQPADHVLEIGFGPGHGIQQVARIATQGRVAGVDFSETMLRQASRRNAAAITAESNCISATPPLSCIRRIPSTRSFPRTWSISGKILWRTCKNSGAS